MSRSFCDVWEVGGGGKGGDGGEGISDDWWGVGVVGICGSPGSFEHKRYFSSGEEGVGGLVFGAER